ncbi:MAG: NTP transferase domain-containing protein [Proteobacteria bacterium]|nr:NTP transferase domain-containing protein [Pseudomonadota bacterium]
MKFGSYPLDEAEGGVLAHSVKLERVVFKKGRVLSADDIAALRRAGRSSVVIARFDNQDVNEDEAAGVLARALAGPHAKVTAPFTGRANLVAETAGVVVLDRARLDALNLVDEAITFATVAPFEVVEPRQMIGTVKVIPFAAPRAVFDRCLEIARTGDAMVRVAALTPHRIGLIQTRLSGTKESVLDGTVRATRARIEALGSTLIDETRCDHDAAAVGQAIRDFQPQRPDILLIAGASAVVDRRDVIPAGIEAAGGVVEHFGMPVDPGNLLLLGRLADKPVLGLPGCARSPKINGFDWVLQRLCADLTVTKRDIMLMGAGGLLMETPLRGQPRERERPSTAAKAPRIAALVLAAGQSRRMGRNKLLLPIEGTPMVARTVDALIASVATDIVVVTGHQADPVRAALAGRSVAFVHNPDFATGLASSLKAGLAALPADADGVLVCLGDMPLVMPAHLDRLIAAFNPVEGRLICVPTYDGKRGNPVLWARQFFAEMHSLSGDVGARGLIERHAEALCEVAMTDAGVLLDVDTPDVFTTVAGTALPP